MRSQPTPKRDHIFISYAHENAVLADWIARKLASFGYAVWYDRLKLLGGEPWPQDIEDAIENRSIRMLALISAASKNKPHPTGERKKGDAIGRDILKIKDFVIPLNVDLQHSSYPWDIFGIQYIDFTAGWAHGITGVLKKLDSINAPRVLTNGPTLVAETMAEGSAIRPNSELIVSNCFRVTGLPAEIQLFTADQEATSGDPPPSWVHYRVSDTEVAAFDPPPAKLLQRGV
jgi:hypothetical protein